MTNGNAADRAEPHTTLRRIAKELGGRVDGGDLKTHALGMPLYRFILGNLTSHPKEQERRAGSANLDDAKLSGADCEFHRARHDVGLNETLSHINADIEGPATGGHSENDITGLFDNLDATRSELGFTAAKCNEKLRGTAQSLSTTSSTPVSIARPRMVTKAIVHAWVTQGLRHSRILARRTVTSLTVSPCQARPGRLRVTSLPGRTLDRVAPPRANGPSDQPRSPE